LHGALVASSEEAITEAELRAREAKPQWWKKQRDTPLGEVVERKLARRAAPSRKRK
jgi:hypothetical protein